MSSKISKTALEFEQIKEGIIQISLKKRMHNYLARLPDPAIKTLEIIMNHFIITAIVILAAAKAKAQVKDNLTKPKRREKFEGKRGLVANRTGHKKKTSQMV